MCMSLIMLYSTRAPSRFRWATCPHHLSSPTLTHWLSLVTFKIGYLNPPHPFSRVIYPAPQFHPFQALQRTHLSLSCQLTQALGPRLPLRPAHVSSSQKLQPNQVLQLLVFLPQLRHPTPPPRTPTPGPTTYSHTDLATGSVPVCSISAEPTNAIQGTPLATDSTPATHPINPSIIPSTSVQVTRTRHMRTRSQSGIIKKNVWLSTKRPLPQALMAQSFQSEPTSYT